MSSGDAGYYGILPAEVRYDKELPANAKLLFVEITSLCRLQGYCWATNAYFADILGATERTVTRWVKILCNKGNCFTTTKTFRWEDGTVKKVRYICLSKKAADDLKALNQEDILSRHHIDISVQNHIDKNVLYNKNNNELNKSLMDTNVSIVEISPETYGKAEINQLFEVWEQTTGLPITSNRTKNRYACNNLIGKYGVDGVEKLIRVVEKAQTDRYAPRVADFCDLQAKLNQLLVWAKGKAHSSSVISVEDF